MIKRILNEAKSKDTLTSIPAQMYNEYIMIHAQRGFADYTALAKFNIKEDIEYVVKNNINILGYQTTEDMTMTFSVLRNKKRRDLTTNVIAGIYTLDGFPLQKEDKILLTKGNEIELYCLYDAQIEKSKLTEDE